MVKLIENLLIFLIRLYAISNKLESFDSRLDTISSKLDTYYSRLSCIEGRAGSHQLEITDLSDRVVALENLNVELEAKLETLSGSNSVNIESGWEPVGSPETRIVLLGDSNLGGKSYSDRKKEL